MVKEEDGGGASSYGARLAEDYDSIYGDVFDTEGAVDFLADLAPGGRVLELGVGTGRIPCRSPLAGSTCGASMRPPRCSGGSRRSLVARPSRPCAATLAPSTHGVVRLLTWCSYSSTPSTPCPLKTTKSRASPTQPRTWLRGADSWSRRGCPVRLEVAMVSNCGLDGWGAALPVWSSKNTTRRSRSSRRARS